MPKLKSSDNKLSSFRLKLKINESWRRNVLQCRLRKIVSLKSRDRLMNA